MKDVKQVIVIRRDLKMRRGKEIAQGAHASQLWLLKRVMQNHTTLERHPNLDGVTVEATMFFSEAERLWMTGNYRKITVQVDSEKELQELYDQASVACLESHIVTDHGITEFHGVETKTALAIGPDYSELIDPITSKLKLY